MSANLLQEIPTVVPIYSTNGSFYNPNQQIEFEVPASVQSTIPREHMFQLDVSFPAVSTTNNLANYNPYQAFGPAGIHSLLRDVVVYDMMTGQEIDRINYYDQACKILPFHLSESDSSAYLSQQEGLNLWKAQSTQRGAPIDLDNKLNSTDPFDLHYFHITSANNNPPITGTGTRIVRYSFPIRFGFMNAEEEYLNFHGLRIVLTLNPASECVDYVITGRRLFLQNTGANSAPVFITASNAPSVVPQFAFTLGAPGAQDIPIEYLSTSPATYSPVDKSNLLALANAYPVGTIMTLTNALPATENVVITGWSINGNNVNCQFTTTTLLAANNPAIVSFPNPPNRNLLNYSVQNPILYVRQLNTDPMVIQQRLVEMKNNPDSMIYSFRTLYNYPLSINANVSNPVLNFNSLSLKYTQGLVFVFKNESDMSNMSAEYPARLSSVLLSSATSYPTSNPNIRQYQIKIGNKLMINQPIDISNLVPQVLNKEIQNFMEIACGKKFCNASYHSMDSAVSLGTTTKTDIDQYYNRVISTVVVNNSDSSMDITGQNIQLLLFTPSSADPSSYTCNLFVSHYKHLMTTPNGIVIDE